MNKKQWIEEHEMALLKDYREYLESRLELDNAELKETEDWYTWSSEEYDALQENNSL